MKVILSILLSFALLAAELPVPGQAVPESAPETEFTAEGQQEEEGEESEKDTGSVEEDKKPIEERKEVEKDEGNPEEEKKFIEGKDVFKDDPAVLQKPGDEERQEIKSQRKAGEEKAREEDLAPKMQEKMEGLGLVENQRYDAPDAFYMNKEGYFFFYVRKEGEKLEDGEWYKLSLSVANPSANDSQKINWKMKRIGTMPRTEKDNVQSWITNASNKEPATPDKFSMKIETGKAWEKSGQDDLGINPVLGVRRKLTDELKKAGYPSPKTYFVMCGKILYTVPGYRMYFDETVFEDMKSMDIAPENKQIQKKDKDLESSEESWTGDGFFKFGIDTNNIGMTNYGTDGTFHHSMYGFYLKPNKYKVRYNANGGSGSANDQNATYDQTLTLRKRTNFSREGYTLAGWNTKADGTGKAYKLGEKKKNLTDKHNATITLYAQWTPNTLKVTYNANGGKIDRGREQQDIQFYVHNWNYKTAKQAPVSFDIFGLSRSGYTRKDGAEWNTKADGTGRSFDQDVGYDMIDYAPDIKTGNRQITLYAQWEPNVYAITLDNRLTNPDRAGTGKLYKKYTGGVFSDSNCTKKMELKTGKIDIPQKAGYKFKGYYSGFPGNQFAQLRKEKVNASGILTGEPDNFYDDETWYAEYDYLIGCEDYADIPCDMEKADGDNREDLGVRLTYDNSTRKVTAITTQPGCSITLTGQPAGTEIGEFKSILNAGSASGNSSAAQSVELPITILEGAAYRLKMIKGDKAICDHLVYYKDGRFRTLVKLGEQKEKEASSGSSLAGSAWGTKEAAYGMYQYDGCSEIKDIQKPGKVQRYFRYKDVNMAYSGNGATAGNNILEYDVSLENIYQFRENGFIREVMERKQTKDAKAYECKVKYSFQGWEMTPAVLYLEKQQEQSSHVYQMAKAENALSSSTREDIRTYQPVSAKKAAHAAEYINLLAKWDAFPTIVVTPGEKLEFYEGEEVTKEKIINCLTAHDKEDNDKNTTPYKADLNDKLRIVKVSYPESKNHSQAAYEEIYEKDVPGDFLLDTYYLKLEKNEAVNVLVTFAVTDSRGNTTEEDLPIKVKYNNYPKISSKQVFYYLKEEANRGEITEEALVKRASAKDAEDGDITGKLGLKGFDAQAIKMQTKAKAEFEVTYQVTDSYKKTTYKTIKVLVWDEDAAIAQMPKNYVRYISRKYLNTLEKDSAWREPENFAYLKGILKNDTPIETWIFAHTDVLAVQEWITENGKGNWKVGQDANRGFLVKFAHCRK